MGIDLIVAVTIACLFAIVAMLAISRVDNLQQDVDEQTYWRHYWEREADKYKRLRLEALADALQSDAALSEALALLGESGDYVS